MRTLIRKTSSLLFAVSALVISSASAQTTVSTGASYANEVYYDLANGVVRTEPLAAWDIAFQIQGYASSIMVNGGMGVALYSVPDKTVEEWDGPLDTTGMSTWDYWYNSPEQWELGAFNMGVDYNTGNFGWGEYNMNTHIVSGTTVYVIVLPNRTAKKIMIDGLSGGSYNFRYANLDGTEEVTASLKKSDFAGKQFGYYSITEGKVVDREPAASGWDLVFGKYTDMAGPDVPYTVTGVRARPGLQLAKVETGSPATVAAPDESAYTTIVNTIGYNWKSFTGSTYKINDSLVFFAKDDDGSIYRLIFTGFGGSANGDFVFNQQRLDASSVSVENGATAVAALYPSIASAGSVVELVYSLDRTTTGARAAIHDATGRIVSTIDLDGAAGLHRATVTAPDASGLYFVTIQSGAARLSQRLIVR